MYMGRVRPGINMVDHVVQSYVSSTEEGRDEYTRYADMYSTGRHLLDPRSRQVCALLHETFRACEYVAAMQKAMREGRSSHQQS